MTDLTTKSCAACEGWVPPLGDDQITLLKAKLDPAWEIDNEAKSLSRKFVFQAFAKAVYTPTLPHSSAIKRAITLISHSDGVLSRHLHFA